MVWGSPLRRASLLGLAVVLLGSESVAGADVWPEPRQNRRRDGRLVDSPGGLDAPTVRHAAHLGGRLSPVQALVADVDGEGNADILTIVSGRLVLRDGGGRLLWQTLPHSLSHLVAVDNLDGATPTRPEVVAVRSAKPGAEVMIFAGDSGGLLWTSKGLLPEGSYGFEYFNTMLVDLTSAAQADLLVVPTNADAYAFNFGPATLGADGWENVVYLWDGDGEASQNGYQTTALLPLGNYNAPIVGQFDLDPTTRDLFVGTARFHVCAAGACTGNQPQGNYFIGYRAAVDVDADGFDEVFMADNNGNLLPMGFGLYDPRASAWRWAFLYGAVPAGPPAVRVGAAPLVRVDGALRAVVNVFNDAASEQRITDGVASSIGEHDGIQALDAWTALVVDVATGTRLVELVGEVGLGWLADGDELYLLSIPSAGPSPADLGELHAHRYGEAGGVGSLVLVDSRAESSLVFERRLPVNDNDPHNTTQGMRGIVADPGNGAVLITTQDPSGDTWLTWWSPGRGITSGVTRQLQGAVAVTGLGSWQVDGDQSRWLVGRSDGVIEVIDSSFAAQASFPVGFLSTAEPLVLALGGDERQQVVTARSDGLPVLIDTYGEAIATAAEGAVGTLQSGECDAGHPGRELIYLERDRLGALSAVCAAGSLVPSWKAPLPQSSNTNLRAIAELDPSSPGDELVVWFGNITATIGSGFVAVRGDGEVAATVRVEDEANLRCAYPYDYLPALADLDGDGDEDEMISTPCQSARAFSLDPLLDGSAPQQLFIAPAPGIVGAVLLGDVDGQPGDEAIFSVDEGAFVYSLSGPTLLHRLHGQSARGQLSCLVDADGPNAGAGLDIVRSVGSGLLIVHDGRHGRIRQLVRLAGGARLPSLLEAFEVEGTTTHSESGATCAMTAASPGSRTSEAVEGDAALVCNLGAAAVSLQLGTPLPPGLAAAAQLALHVGYSAASPLGLSLILRSGADELHYTRLVQGSDPDVAGWKRVAFELRAPASGDATLLDAPRSWEMELSVSRIAAPPATLRLDALHLTGADPNLTAPLCGAIDSLPGEDIVVGATDGFLYAVEALRGDVVWSSFLGDAIGAVAPFRQGLNAPLELVATLGSGHVVFLTEPALPAPTTVRDVAMGFAAPDFATDADLSESRRRLAAAWEPVDGASGYRVSVFAVASNGEGLRVLPSDAERFLEIGTSTEIILDAARGLGPQPLGAELYVEVQAYGGGIEVSPPQRSDGVVIEDLSAPRVELSTSADATLALNPTRQPLDLALVLTDATELAGYRLAVASEEALLVEHTLAVAGELHDASYSFADGDDSGVTLPDGLLRLEVVVWDSRCAPWGAGCVDVEHSASLTRDILIDRLAPAPPSFVEPDPGEEVVALRLLFVGLCSEAGIDIEVMNGAEVLCGGVCDGAGWQCAPSMLLPLGPTFVSAQAVDGAGNRSEATPLSFIVRAPPPPPSEPDTSVPIFDAGCGCVAGSAGDSAWLLFVAGWWMWRRRGSMIRAA